MIKLILLAKRKKGMSHAAFIDYYENTHIPLCDRIYPVLSEASRCRNYINHEKCLGELGLPSQVDYDVISEVVWPNPEAYARRLDLDVNPELALQVRADEDNLFDKKSMRLFFC